MFNNLNTLRIFFDEPTREFSVRETSRILKISPATASMHLKEISNNGILSARKERMLMLYKSNLENDLYKDIKLFYNMRRIKESGLVDKLNKFYLKPTIIFFGSGASGMDTETSDFDIVIISEKTSKISNLEAIEKKLKRKVQIFAVKNIKELKNNHLINNILNGITLQGGIKWI